VSAAVIEAAGGVLWRPTADGPEVALVHRPKYDDWSLPKGKLDTGEHPLLGALREIEEETGCVSRPARPLGQLRYRVNDRPKRVRYWACRAVSGDFHPSREVDAVEWLTLDAARRQLTVARDGAVLERFAADPRDTSAFVVVRHASAGDRKTWRGEDRHRPLDKAGQRQAVALTGVLRAYGVTLAVSADVERCRATLAPFAAACEVPIKTVEELVAEKFGTDPEPGVAVALAAAAGAPAVVCGQREVIGDLLARLLDRLGAHPGTELTEVPKGAAVVLHLLRPAELAAIELLPEA